MDAHVTVLLSSWNGELHLPEQLRSLDAQSHSNWTLGWRDDGSSDASRSILRDFAGGMPLADDGRRLGAARSFTALLRAHLAAGGGGLVAYADQDDVWLPGKLARGVGALGAVPSGTPALYCARQRLVDARLAPVGLSPPIRAPSGLADALAGNVATGCTVMLNEAAQRVAARVDPPAGTLHDWWALLAVVAAGGRVIADDEPVILYRQHEGNAVGSPEGAARRARAALRRGPGAFMSVFRANVGALAGRPEPWTERNREVLRDLGDALAGGAAGRIRCLLRHRIRRRTIPETALFALWFVLG